MNEFGHLLLKLCERRSRSIKELARAAGLKGTSRIYYAIRAKEDTRRKTPLREDELLALAGALRLNEAETEQFVISAHLTAAPDLLRRYVRRLEAKVPH
jgi:hypothetical protein